MAVFCCALAGAKSGGRPSPMLRALRALALGYDCRALRALPLRGFRKQSSCETEHFVIIQNWRLFALCRYAACQSKSLALFAQCHFKFRDSFFQLLIPFKCLIQLFLNVVLFGAFFLDVYP